MPMHGQVGFLAQSLLSPPLWDSRMEEQSNFSNASSLKPSVGPKPYVLTISNL
jgi:hypothetical protein